jgi:hypothetical protein
MVYFDLLAHDSSGNRFHPRLREGHTFPDRALILLHIEERAEKDSHFT